MINEFINRLVLIGFGIGLIIALVISLIIQLNNTNPNLESRPETTMYVNPITKDSVLIWVSDSSEVFK